MRIINSIYITIHWERVRRSSSGVNVADYRSNYCCNAIQLKSGPIESPENNTRITNLFSSHVTGKHCNRVVLSNVYGQTWLSFVLHQVSTISFFIYVVRWTIINIESRMSPVIVRIGLRNSVFTNLFSEPHT